MELTGKPLYDETCFRSSKLITKAYSTSFSIGIRTLSKDIRMPIYAIYGFVRFADEIVDTFHNHDKETLLNRFEEETYLSIKEGISTNPVLQCFQITVNQYSIRKEYISAFFHSMRLDLSKKNYGEEMYSEYIYGSAEVVGLMCLQVFCKNDHAAFEKLVPTARSLGAAFQKVNFMRDLKNDIDELGRSYFPGVDFVTFTEKDKKIIVDDIQKDFDDALEGIKQLPSSAKFGVYVAYLYYKKLFSKISNTTPDKIKTVRIRIPNFKKFVLLFQSYFVVKLKMV